MTSASVAGSVAERGTNMQPAASRKTRSGIALLAAVAAVILGIFVAPSRTLTAPLSQTVTIKDLTWVEVQTAVKSGYTTVIVPTGGIEQNGPHMIVGKHDYIVGWAAEKIARAVTKTLVAPVVSYVPQGQYEPAQGHLRFPGTIGLPEPVFAQVLEGIARSLRAGGFKTICFIGDHGGNQAMQKEVADKLTKLWANEGVRIIHVAAYYEDDAQIKKLIGEGETVERIGQHASIIDTSELMAIHPAGVDLTKYVRPKLIPITTGVVGDPSSSTAQRGEELIAMRVAAAVLQIKSALLSH
jgi:creatinine amidohydrolase